MFDVTKIKYFKHKIILIVIALFWTFAPSFAAATTTHKSHTKHHSKHHTHHGKKHHHAKQHHIVQTAELSGFIPTNDCRDPALLDSTPTEKLVAPMEKNVVNFVDQTVSNLNYSSYKLGGKRFDPQRGVYILDCSNFVDHVLQETAPEAYSSLVNATGADTPASQHYYDFFRELSDDPDHYWNKVDDIAQLRPGDILVFRYKNHRGVQTGGHVMVVMNKPIHDTDVYLVRVADSAPTRHSEDTRDSHESGIGIGTLLLKSNPKTGHPSAFAWGLDGYWNKNVIIAMARPMEVG